MLEAGRSRVRLMLTFVLVLRDYKMYFDLCGMQMLRPAESMLRHLS